MPIHDLPMSVEEILDETSFSVLTHVHPDHIDIAADGTLGKYLDKELPIIAPTEEIALKLRADGFKDICLMSDEFFRYGRSPIELMPTPARHGTLKPCGVARVHETLPEAELVITHMDNVAHASIDREQMRERLAKRGIEHYYMPEDGETLDF